MKDIGDEIEFKEGGLMRQRAKKVLDDAADLLEKIAGEGLFSALEKGMFGDVKRLKTGGKGLEGVVAKGDNYLNPYVNLMKGGN
jgi:beta-lysine 5,6-aminomutase alpha subunit